MYENRLNFLNGVLGSRVGFYKSSKFLKSNFEDDVLIFSFVGSGTMTETLEVDLGVKMSDGSVLTDNKNRPLLNLIKYWVNAVVHPDNTDGRGIGYAATTGHALIDGVLLIIDYFLLNDKHFKLHMCGLEAINGDDFKCLANTLLYSNSTSESIYGWSYHLSDYLLTNSSSLTRSELSEIIAQADVDFEEITSAQLEDNNLDIPTERVPYVRAWLWREGFYCKSRKNKPYRFSPSSTKLSKSIYGNNTLRGHRGHKPLPEILYLGSKEPSCREYPGAPVSTVGGGMISRTFWNTFCKAIKALNLLFTREFSEENLPLPTQESINVFENISIDKLRDGRYKTLPSRIVFDSINNAIQFHIKYSEVLLSSLDLLMKVYSEKLKGNSHNHSEKIQELLNENEFRNCLDTKLKQIGVECWGLDHKRGETTGRRFEEMRKNKSFSHLLRIYYGGAYIVVCSLMARRASELNELSVKDCLDNTESFLIFRGAKTTRHLQGKRKLITRPIDEIAVEMINVLKDVQNIYLKHGLIDDLGNLFDAPSVQHGGSLLSVNNYPNSVRDSIDFFCDYFETPLNEMGQRYYIRPHQMRRFFALSFFWGSGFGGMETLRWFLGHADAQHLYHYITESSPGAVLVHAKAQFLTETIDEHKELGDLLSRKYGASDFSILESDELEDYIRELIECGDIELEPDFFEDDDKKQYELILTVRKVGRG